MFILPGAQEKLFSAPAFERGRETGQEQAGTLEGQDFRIIFKYTRKSLEDLAESRREAWILVKGVCVVILVTPRPVCL